MARPKKKSVIYEALERLDSLMAIGESRATAKAEAQIRGASTFAFSTGRMHSYQTRNTYQPVVMRFVRWCRERYHLNRLAQIDACADELVCAYLAEGLAHEKSAWTVQTERSALRLFFGRRDLAISLALPPRRQSDIRRSRRPAIRDRHFQPDNWLPLVQFELACGLRREELRDLRVGDIVRRPPNDLLVRVRRGKGGKTRDILVFPDQEQSVLQVIEGRNPQEHVFPRLPMNADIQALRRQFAQALYVRLAGCPLPTPWNVAALDQGAVLVVSRALGHNRHDVVLRHYLR